MVARVPVLGENQMAKQTTDAIDYRHNFLTTWHGKSPAIAKIILHIDDQQNVAVDQFDHPRTSPLLPKPQPPTNREWDNYHHSVLV